MMQEKHVKQLLREEHGSSYKPGGSVKVALVFPNSYYLGMSSLGFQVILDEINRHPDASCERVFLSGDESDVIPRSFETQRPLSEFDIIGFSVSFELDYFNVVKVLYAAKIPLRARDRSLRDPFIVAGGICCSFNPEPLSGFIDVFVIGDGEELVYNLISEYHNWRQTQARPRAKRRNGRRDLLHRLSRIEGVYIPLLYDVAYKADGTLASVRPQVNAKPKVERFSVGELERFDTTSKILTPNTEFASSFLVEVTRGCARRCRFCVASYIQRCRIRSKDKILRSAQSELAQKAEKIGLVGSSVTDHPEIDVIASSLVGMGNRVSIASMRADSVSDALLDALAASGRETITLAPETASARLKRIIGKNIPLETVFKVIRSALKKGILNVKLYFMIGLPTETQEDVDNIVMVVERTRKLMFDSPRPKFPIKKGGWGVVPVSPRLTVSISPFVPKPHTPFQWCQMEDVKTLSQKLQFLRRKLGGIGGVRVPFSSARWSAIQGVLARGDRRLVNVLEELGTGLKPARTPWNRALKKNGLTQDFYLQRPRQLDEAFPWDHLSMGISKARLVEQFLAIGS